MTEMQNGTPLHDDRVSSEHQPNGHLQVNGYATPTSQIESDSHVAPSQPVDETVDNDKPAEPVAEEDAAATEAADDNTSRPPAAKKRKLTDSEVRKAIGQRPVSPPWKRITVDGPTSFMEEGRRKSSRTNFVPVELQPNTDKRRTRGAASHTAPIIQSKYGGAATLSSTIPTESPDRRKSLTLSKSSPAAATQKSPNKPNARTPSQSSPLKTTANVSAITGKRPYHRKQQPPAPVPSVAPKTSQDSEQPLKRKVGRPPKKVLLERAATANGFHKTDEDKPTTRRAGPGLASDQRPQRLNLRVRAPAPEIQHPGHVGRRQMLEERHGDIISKRPRFASFEDWLEFTSREGLDMVDQEHQWTDAEVQKEAALRNRIAEAAEPGGLLSQERCTFYRPEDGEDPPRLYAHQDRLIAHARYFQKLMSQERVKHQRAAKECAEKAAALVKNREEQAYQRWKQDQPKTAEEIQREQDDLFRAVYTQLKEDVKRKWGMVGEVVEQTRKEQWEAEQERLGNEALNEVIENARGSLSKRRRNLSDIGSDEDTDADAASDESGGDNSSSQGEDADSNMSESHSDSEEEDQMIQDADEGLSVEQLRLKYAQLPKSQRDHAFPVKNEKSNTISQADEDSKLLDPATNVAKDNDLKSVVTLSDKLEATAAGATEDESDPSIDMDSEDYSSEEEDDDDVEEDDEAESEESSDDAGHGLLGFYGKQTIQQEFGSLSSMPKGHVYEDKVEGAIPVSQKADHEGSASKVSPPNDFDTQSRTDLVKVNGATSQESEKRLGSDLPNGIEEKPDVISNSTLDGSEAGNTSKASPTPQNIVSASSITTPVPSLLRGTLREYQHFGLDWLAKLYATNDHGILADEMGLGKTIQTISLLAHLAVHYEIWGPHLIIVPTSVMLNWEMEFKKFLPGFKILTYYGTLEERKKKRQGMSDSNKWNVWITSYQLVTNDIQVFKRKAWHYMVLDEAHNIKNFRSMRWQTLLTVRTHSRLLLTGTPLQNNLTELWSLLFFLEPEKCLDLEKFNKHFKKSESQILEDGRDAMNSHAREMVTKLHEVLRPHLLRRLKADVEKQLPGKFEHVVYCRLSKRQRQLYDGFMSRAQTRESLASGNTFSIMNALMQLRKVCNHPDLFETHAIKTSFAMPKSAVADYEIKELLVRRRLFKEPMSQVDLNVINLIPGSNETLSALDTIQRQRLGALGTLRQLANQQWQRINHSIQFDGSSAISAIDYFKNCAKHDRFETLRHHAYLTSLRSQRRPLHNSALEQHLSLGLDNFPDPPRPNKRALLSDWYTQTSSALSNMVQTVPQRSSSFHTKISKFACVTPKVVAPDMIPLSISSSETRTMIQAEAAGTQDPFHEARVRLSIAFPDKRLLQYDCGKLQRLDGLLRKLQSGGHRALIFTQMTKVLDILEQFLNIHGHRYLRLDGATKIEQRQALMDRFNNDPRIPVFILSSRSGGIGINLTGADTVIFYDMDWNPAMDKQCQDRCHRIGQTREVHIYRLISEHTIEANILRKANQKRMLDDVVIQEGDFTTEYLNNMTVKDVIGQDEDEDGLGEQDADANAAIDKVIGVRSSGRVLEQVEDVEDTQAARLAEREGAQNEDVADFDERGAAAAAARAANGVDANNPQSMMTSSAAATAAATDNILDDGQQELLPVPSCDEYMIRFLEWELRDVPLQAAIDEENRRNKARKKAKKGKEHIVVRKR